MALIDRIKNPTNKLDHVRPQPVLSQMANAAMPMQAPPKSMPKASTKSVMPPKEPHHKKSRVEVQTRTAHVATMKR